MTAEQARFIGLFTAQVGGASALRIEDLGAGYLQLTVTDKEGAEVTTKRVFPSANRLPDGELP